MGYPKIHVAVAIIKNAANQFLIAERPAHKYAPGLWEFPGGKVEAGESVLEALVREIREEVGINILSATPLLTSEHTYPDRTVLLDVWLIQKFEGDPVGLENQLVRWAPLEELHHYTFPEGNKVILKALNSI